MNTKYKELAYERSILLALVRFAKDELLPIEGSETARKTIICEELARSESVVPEDPIIDVVLKLERLVGKREAEMGKFNFVETESIDEQEWAEEEQPKAPVVSGGQALGKVGKKRKNRGRQGGNKAPAASSG